MGIVEEQHFWHALCTVVGREELGKLSFQERSDRHEELTFILKGIFLCKSQNEWVKILTNGDSPAASVYTFVEKVFRDLQIRYRIMVEEIDDPVEGGVL